MMSATGEYGMTLLELTMVIFLLGLIGLVAWPSVRRHAIQAMLASEATHLERALRETRETALARRKIETLDAAALCRRFIPKPPVVRFYADGTADSFSARPNVPSDLAVIVDSTGRILVFRETI